MCRPAPRGVALVLVSALLVVLVSLAVALGDLMSQGRGVAQASVTTARAALLSRSGVEYGLARLSRRPAPDPRPAAFRDDWTCRDGPEVPWESLRNPSYHHGEAWDDAPTGDGRYTPADGWGAAQDRDGDGRYSGWTGRLRAMHPGGDTFSLRVEDESGKINANGGVLDGGDRDSDGTPDHRDVEIGPSAATATETGRGFNGQLRRILDILGTAGEDADGDGTLDAGEDWDGDGALDAAPIGMVDLGRVILENRPAGGYASVAAVEREVARATGGVRPDLVPYVTVASWVDRAVVRPNAHAAQGAVNANSLLKTGRAPLALEEGGRPPVNLNVAPGPVLVALVSGLRGGSWFGEVAPVRYEIPAVMAGRIAGEILARRPFVSWEEFGTFCDSLAPATISGMARTSSDPGQRLYQGGNLCGADILKANFDPNTRSNKEFSDDLLYRFVDKTDLEVWSTEGCLAPTGVFRVSSLGRVRDARGERLAEARCDAAARTHSLLRHTSQADFVGGRAPSDAPRYLSLADPACRTNGASAAWNDWGAGQGLAVTTYPCCMGALPANAAWHDGAVGLATVETDTLDPVGGTLLFFHHFDDGWQADAGAAPAREDGPSDDALQTDATAGVWPGAGQEPGTLYPDGVHAQTQRAPAYAAVPHLPEGGRRGCASYWVKRHQYGFALTCVRWIGPQSDITTQALLIGQGGLLVESLPRVGANDLGAEDTARSVQDPSIETLRPGLRWRLVSCMWDTDEDDRALGALAVSLGARGPGVLGSAYGDYDPSVGAQDLVDPSGTSRWLVVGGQRAQKVQEYANQIVDELAICDFGDVAIDAQQKMRAWADLRYAEGRYYKENDGVFLSPAISLAGGAPARLLWVSWTGYLPSDPRAEATLLGSQVEEAPVSRVSDATLSQARIEVELTDAAGNPFAPPRSLPESGAVGVTLPGFRYRVRFLPTPGWRAAERMNQPVLETPFFDDITFAYAPPGGPRVLSWEEGS